MDGFLIEGRWGCNMNHYKYILCWFNPTTKRHDFIEGTCANTFVTSEEYVEYVLSLQTEFVRANSVFLDCYNEEDHTRNTWLAATIDGKRLVYNNRHNQQT